MRSLRSTFRQATHCRTLCCSWPRSTRLRANLERSATDFQPIVRLNRDTGQRELVLMRWGLILFWAKEPSIGLRTSCPSQSDGVRWRKTWLYLRRSCQKVTESPNASLPVNSLRTAAPAALVLCPEMNSGNGGVGTYSADMESRICHPLLQFPCPGHPRLEFAALERDTETW